MGENVGRCDVHREPEPKCLRCHLPDNAHSVRMHGMRTYLYDCDGVTYAAEQGEHGWYEVGVPKGVK